MTILRPPEPFAIFPEVGPAEPRTLSARSPRVDFMSSLSQSRANWHRVMRVDPHRVWNQFVLRVSTVSSTPSLRSHAPMLQAT